MDGKTEDHRVTCKKPIVVKARSTQIYGAPTFLHFLPIEVEYTTMRGKKKVHTPGHTINLVKYKYVSKYQIFY